MLPAHSATLVEAREVSFERALCIPEQVVLSGAVSITAPARQSSTHCALFLLLALPSSLLASQASDKLLRPSPDAS